MFDLIWLQEKQRQTKLAVAGQAMCTGGPLSRNSAL